MYACQCYQACLDRVYVIILNIYIPKKMHS